MLEDPYDEKARVQRKFLRENPEEELSKILAENSPNILAGKSTPSPPRDGGKTKLSEMIQVGGVDTPLEQGSWRLSTGRNARLQPDRTQPTGGGVAPAVKEKESIQIQALTDDTFKKVCIDSGAGESVCPVEAFPSYKTTKTAKTGTKYMAAGGQKLTNV